MEIDGKKIGQGYPTYIIAEMSANHNQEFDKAVALVHAAKNAGADAIKLQTYTADTLVNKDSPMITQGTLWDGQTLYDLYKKAYMPWEWQPKLKKLADQIGITLFSTAYDLTSVDFLYEMDMPAYKIASFEITHLPMIEYIASKGKPMIVSTGMATKDEIWRVFKILGDKLSTLNDVAFLKCTSQYPAPLESMNLKAITEMKDWLTPNIGLSDHSMDIRVPILAVACGACIIEKHLKLSRDILTPDSAFSLTPQEFGDMVRDIRECEKALGSYIGPTESEKPMLDFRWNPKTQKRGLW